MFNKPHHRTIAKLLHAFDCELLERAECYFGGGTSIVLALREYRESVDVDFLCASAEGYRLLRNTVGSDLGGLLKTPMKHLREVRTDQYKIYTILDVDGTPVKVELVREGRIPISGRIQPDLSVPVLSKEDMYAEKLLANADRGLDKAVMSRDLIDIAMMVDGWGSIPRQSWDKAYEAYGDQLITSFHKAVELIADRAYLGACLKKMQMDPGLVDRIPVLLDQVAQQLPLTAEASKSINRRAAALGELHDRAGSAYTLWQHATRALASATSAAAVDWGEVERAVAVESITKHGQSADEVENVLCQYSPGAVLGTRQRAIAQLVRHLMQTSAPENSSGRDVVGCQPY